jgi:hypothetical protein
VRLDDADDDIEPFATTLLRRFQHGVGLADTGRRADKDLEAAALFFCRRLEQRLRRGPLFVCRNHTHGDLCSTA